MNKEVIEWTSSSKQQEAPSETKKEQRGYSFRTDENKGKNIIPRMR